MERKGFAITGVLYVLLLIFLASLTMLLFNLQNRKMILDQLKLDVVEAVESDNNYEYLLNKISELETKVLDINKVYPVGSIYISTNDTNPGTLFGGTWEKYASGRTLIGEGSGTDSNNIGNTFTLNQTGGEYSHKLTISEMPSHNHITTLHGENIYFAYGNQNATPFSGRGPSSTEGQISSSTGGDQYHNNIQPYIVVSIWKRVS